MAKQAALSGSSRPPTRIRSVGRAMEILLFVARNESASAKEIASALRMATPTVHHLLNTLADEGVLAKDSRKRYDLGPTIGVLVDAYEHQVMPPEYLLAPLRLLAESTGESAYLSGWRQGGIAVLASVAGSHAVRVSELRRGYQDAAHARASGKLLLAYARPEMRTAYLTQHPLLPLTQRTIVNAGEFTTELERIREQGYAADIEEFKEGVGCVSAPVLESGDVIAAYTVSAPIDRFHKERAQLLKAVLSAAAAATRRSSQMPAAGGGD